MSELIRVVILEDHQSTVDGYLYRLGEHSDINIVATPSYGEELEPTLAENSPIHVLILDVDVPTSRENRRPYPILHILSKLRQNYPTLRALVITMHSQPALIRMASESGISGFVLKDDPATQKRLDSVVRMIAAGGIHYSQEAHQKLMSKTKQYAPLSPRQVEVLSLCAAYPDKTTSEIATIMGIADATVRTVLSKCYDRYGVRSRTAVVARAEAEGLLVIPGTYSSNESDEEDL